MNNHDIKLQIRDSMALSGSVFVVSHSLDDHGEVVRFGAFNSLVTRSVKLCEHIKPVTRWLPLQVEHDMILEIQYSYRQLHCWDVTRTTPLSQAIKDVDRDTGLYNEGEVWLPLLVTS